MDLHTAIRTRRTVHAFLPGPVPDDVLERALAAAHLAPCHKHTWPWRFTVVGPETRRALADLAVRHKQGDAAPLPPAVVESIRRGWLDPGALVMVSQRRADDAARAREDYAAVATAVQNLLLSVHADGFGAKWGTGAVTRLHATSALLGLDPDREPVVAAVFIGLPARVPEVPRPPLSDVVRRLP